MKLFRLILPSFSILLSLLLASCNTFLNQAQPTEDKTYFTPIPERTIQSYRPGDAVENALQAVIAARAGLLGNPRLSFTVDPQVASADELTMDEARQAAGSSGPAPEGLSGSDKVWLVVLQGQAQVIPPGPNVKPLPPAWMCANVIVNEKTGDAVEFVNKQCQ